jgi:iron uptake system EfeUOB component EfeO/EfeM
MRRFSIVTAGAVLAVTLSACGSSTKSGSSGEAGAEKVPFTLTDAGCDPAHLELRAGPTTFEVTNDGADAVTEMEIIQDGRIIGEVENLTPGLSGSFSATLSPGEYETACPNGSSAAKGTLVVTGDSSSTTAPASADASSAVEEYRERFA